MIYTVFIAVVSIVCGVHGELIELQHFEIFVFPAQIRDARIKSYLCERQPTLSFCRIQADISFENDNRIVVTTVPNFYANLCLIL